MISAVMIDPDMRCMTFPAAGHVADFLCEKHIYNAQPDEYRTLWGAHELLREIEDGTRWVMLVWDGDFCCGCVHGMLDDYGVFTCHIMFMRQIDAVKACLLCEEELKKYCREHNHKLLTIRGNIAVRNRAALRCARLFGSKNMGMNIHGMMWYRNELIPTYTMEKEIVL
jgi:hypothetical protein